MKKPIDAVEAEFNKGGMFFLNAAKISDSFFEGNYIGVEVEILVMSDTPVTAPDFSVSVVNRRDVAMFVTDWEVIERDEQTLLKFSVFQRIPGNCRLHCDQTPMSYMSFLDMCFFAGNEAIPEVYGDDVATKGRVGVPATDLGWHLPVRFMDPLIDALGKIDGSMLAGNIKEALIYGPIVVNK